MIWNQLVLQVLNGLGVAAILVIAASGLAIIFGIAGVINMAHGTFIMVGAYTAALINQWGGDMFMAIPAAFVVVALLGLIVERGVIQWIYDRPLETLLATWGVAIILEVAARLIFGPLGLKVDWPDLLDGNIKIFARPPHYPY
ncbi:MAG: ABC transporter permease subunit, partial [bacterium]